jgi:hypothetical protein
MIAAAPKVAVRRARTEAILYMDHGAQRGAAASRDGRHLDTCSYPGRYARASRANGLSIRRGSQRTQSRMGEDITFP